MKKKKEMKFNSVLRGLVLENARLEFLVNQFTKPRKKGDEKLPPVMDNASLMKIIDADPKSRVEGENVKKVGEYTQWLIRQYLKLLPQAGEEVDKRELKGKLDLFFEDLYKTTNDLQKFDRFKNRLGERNIDKYSIESLFDAVKDFSLEKTKATSDEKKGASKTFIYPGSDLVYDGPKWAITKVTDKGALGKGAACFFGGYNEETRWCTSAPGLQWFEKYIKDGPLYQVFNKSSKETDKTGLPGERYQFHFPSSQFMDIADRQIQLVDFLNGPGEDMKEYFRPEFLKGLATGSKADKITVNYPNDASSQYIALYGFDEFFENLPENITRLEFSANDRSRGDNQFSGGMPIPDSLGKFKNLDAIHLQNIVSSLPASIGNLKNLIFLSLPDNKNLKELPREIANLPNLSVIKLKGSNPNIKIPDEILKKAEDPTSGLHIFLD